MTTTTEIATPMARVTNVPATAAGGGVSRNPQQVECLAYIKNFMMNKTAKIFVLKGQAGTGKTTLISDIVKLGQGSNYKSIIATPTGRASQVISNKMGKESSTIHSLIYKPTVNDKTGIVTFRLKDYESPNKTIFIIDEASMVSDDMNDSGMLVARNTLLNDLLTYAFINDSGNKIIFIGDPYQLPPVGSEFSPALDINYMSQKIGARVHSYELTEVMRQGANSPILKFATNARKSIMNGTPFPSLPYTMHYSAWDFNQHYMNNFNKDDLARTIMICSSNKSVAMGNKIIREKIYTQAVDNYPRPGDVVMVNQNWTGSFLNLFNGTTGIVQYVSYNEMIKVANLRFVPARIIFTINNTRYVVRHNILLDVFDTLDGKLTLEQERALVHHEMKTNPSYRMSLNITGNKFLGALRLRYAYAITCHKAQGGEWKHVYINPYHNIHDRRWLYTAATRASVSVHSFRLAR